ncbi:hypothetical protein TNCV_1261851 [Trichonephila clavipes]|nr:hypothetical protein TNCV_1261851 [Trichonephila clavipes]
MPLRRNRRQYEQLTDYRGRIIGLNWSNRRIGRHLGRAYGSCSVLAWITEGRVYHRGSGRPRNTNDREDRAIKKWPLRHQQRR